MSKPVLIYKARSEKKYPQGMSKVFFTCAPEDFDKYFIKETDSILWIDNNIECAIWYNQNSDYVFENNEEENEYLSLLHDMNMFVIPITLNFLKGNCRAYSVDFKYAVDNHIPILLIMEERGLESLFETMCGKLQYLDRIQDKETQESFDDKLKKFLNNTLISSDLSRKIQDSFDAYIFLSYRKKDRKEALEVMKEIHSNDFTRDVAIWFDENLTPGEDFSDAIRKVIEKSDLFTMVVTQDLNENPNYVKDKEYPNALSLNKKILPVITKETNINELKNNYQSLPDAVNIKDKRIISERLISLLHKEAYKENNNPEHLYYISLAYLNGIDVEKDIDKGMNILNKAARSNYLPALYKLVDIYENGNWQKIDYYKAIKYQKKIINVLYKTKYDEYKILSYKNKLESLYIKNGDYNKAYELSKIIYEKRKIIFGENDPVTLASLSRLAESYRLLGYYNKAIELYETVYEKRKIIFGENHPDTLASISYLAESYKSLGDYDKSATLFKVVYENYKQVIGDKHPKTLMFLNRLIESYKSLGNYDMTTEFSKVLYDKYKEIFGENHPKTLVSLYNLSSSYRLLGNYNETVKYDGIIYEKHKEFFGEDDPATLTSLSNLAESYYSLGDYNKAIELYNRIYSKYKIVYGDNDQKTKDMLDRIKECIDNH